MASDLKPYLMARFGDDVCHGRRQLRARRWAVALLRLFVVNKEAIAIRLQSASLNFIGIPQREREVMSDIFLVALIRNISMRC
jgi:hypothetical protein